MERFVERKDYGRFIVKLYYDSSMQGYIVKFFDRFKELTEYQLFDDDLNIIYPDIEAIIDHLKRSTGHPC